MRFRSISLVVLLAVLLLSASAQAVVSNVSVIDIVQNAATTWHLAEVEGIEIGSGINRASQANGGVASAIGTTSGFGSVIGDGNDGNRIGNFGVGSVWHDDGDNVAGEVYRITLAAPSDINLINVFGRTDCCQTRDDNLTLILRDVNGTVLHTRNFGIPNIADTGSTTAINGITLEVNQPEPATALLACSGVMGLGLRRRRMA